MAGPLQRLSHTGGAAAAALVGNLSVSGLGFVLSTNTGWPTGAGGQPFGVCIDPGLATEEHILCASQSSGNVVVTSTGRGYDGGVAFAHQAGAVVEHIILAVEVDDANAHIYDQTRRDHSMYAPLDGSAAFTGLVTFNAGITDTGPLTQTGPVNITGNETVSGSLGVGGLTTLGAGVNVTGLAAVTGNATVSGNTTVGGTATTTGLETAQAVAVTGLTGAVAASRYVGATAAGAPTSGTFVVGDWVVDQGDAIWVCSVAGSPGTWVPIPAPRPFHANGPGGTVDCVFAQTTLATLSVPVVANAVYMVAFAAFGTQVTATGVITYVACRSDDNALGPSGQPPRAFSLQLPVNTEVAGGSTSRYIPSSNRTTVFTVYGLSNAGALRVPANNAWIDVWRIA